MEGGMSVEFIWAFYVLGLAFGKQNTNDDWERPRAILAVVDEELELNS